MIDTLEDLGLKDLDKTAEDLGLKDLDKTAEDLGLKDLDKTAENLMEQLEKIIQEKLNISFSDLKNPIVKYLQDHAEEITLEFPNIAPRGDYSNLLEDNDSMTEFLKSLTVEDFKVSSIGEETKYNLLRFNFICTAIDDGDSLEAFTYTSKDGKIKHSFAQYCD